MIYLASPYSHPEAHVREARYHTVCFAAAKLMAEGFLIYSPIAHTHGICIQGEGLGLKYPYEYWQKFDEHMIDLCLAFWILRMDGWEDSKGIKAELEYATKLEKFIKYI